MRFLDYDFFTLGKKEEATERSSCLKIIDRILLSLDLKQTPSEGKLSQRQPCIFFSEEGKRKGKIEGKA